MKYAFQVRFANEPLLDDYINDLLVVSMDDLQIFSNSESDHLDHLKKIISRFSDHNLHISLNNGHFMKQ